MAIIMMAFVCVGFFSCGDDDDEEERNSNNPVPAVTSAKVGDIYYSDGTCSTVLASGKTPIGIVVYVGNDSVSEYKHGLVMALNNSGQEQMYHAPNTYYNYTAGTMEEAISDMKGLEKTKALAEIQYDAAVNALNYNVQVPSGTTGWFIPSIGQWIAVLNNFGAGITKELGFKVFTGGSDLLANINNTLEKTGTEGVDYTSLSSRTGSGQAGYFWSSSFCSRVGIWDVVFNVESGVYLNPSGNIFSSLYIRPFLAF